MMAAVVTVPVSGVMAVVAAALSAYHLAVPGCLALGEEERR